MLEVTDGGSVDLFIASLVYDTSTIWPSACLGAPIQRRVIGFCW